eukprot:2698587-Prymnesium_polylepis.1
MVNELKKHTKIKSDISLVLNNAGCRRNVPTVMQRILNPAVAMGGLFMDTNQSQVEVAVAIAAGWLPRDIGLKAADHAIRSGRIFPDDENSMYLSEVSSLAFEPQSLCPHWRVDRLSNPCANRAVLLKGTIESGVTVPRRRTVGRFALVPVCWLNGIRGPVAASVWFDLQWFHPTIGTTTKEQPIGRPSTIGRDSRQPVDARWKARLGGLCRNG